MIGSIGLLALFSGCAVCPSPYDYDYGGFVSKTPRSDMRVGRVGSIFSDPALTGTAADEMIEEGIEEVVGEEVGSGEMIPLEGVEISAPVALDD